ncbi:MAG: leucine-rich repeat domain-containing protein [Oscillospiraceae bacterium]|nr:leucine-rich repeat domain-containing protein [Oscillospiraceae bacterium]
MKKSHKQALTLILALIMLFATSLSSVTAVGADTPITASISLQSMPPNGTTSTIADVFPDPGLASAVAEDLGKSVNSVVSASELEGITDLWATNRNIVSIDGVQYLTGLQELEFQLNQISDISPLARLTGLGELYLGSNQISDITPLAGLTDLQVLALGYNQISDITPLVGLTDLWLLVLFNNQISDISPLAGLTNLGLLYLEHNQISDISPLAGLTGLQVLSLDGNQISDISPLAGLTILGMLYLDNNQISDISPIAGLTYLWSLYLSDQSITLDDTAINTHTALTVISTDGKPVEFQFLFNNGTYENGMLTWTQTGNNLAYWSATVTIGIATADFSGIVSQYAAEHISEIVTVGHILSVRDHILGKTPLSANERAMMDVNKDGIINIFDVLVMRDWILRRRINAELRMQNAEL